MNRSEYLLVKLNEECVEVAQRCDKALCFSLSEIQPGQLFSNSERIMHEYYDVLASMEMLIEEGILEHTPDRNERRKKKRDTDGSVSDIARSAINKNRPRTNTLARNVV